MKYLVAWIVATVRIHNFALEHEDVGDIENDQFMPECDYHMHDGNAVEGPIRGQGPTRNERTAQLALGKIKQDSLKRDLLGI